MSVRYSQAEYEALERRQIAQRMKATKKTAKGAIQADHLKDMAKGVQKAAIVKSKYNNQKVIDGTLVFDSRKEFVRWRELNVLLKAGEIQDLERQVRYDYSITYKANGKEFTKTGFYRADFVYRRGGQAVTEDAKGYRTADFRRKSKIIKKLFGITILET